MKIFTYVARRGNLTRPNFIRTLGKGLPPLPNHPPAKVGKLPSSFPKPLQFDSPDGKNKIPLILQEYFILVDFSSEYWNSFEIELEKIISLSKEMMPIPDSF